MQFAEASFIQTCELRLEAQRAGFVTETQAMPYHCDAHRVNSGTMATVASAIGNQPLIVPRELVKLWAVRFLGWTQMYAGTPNWTAYLEGQIAGFDAATAWGLVDAGKAIFPDPKNVPPKPPSKQKRSRRTQAEKVSMEEVARGGRRSKKLDPAHAEAVPLWEGDNAA
jgi:hypothetical protein